MCNVCLSCSMYAVVFSSVTCCFFSLSRNHPKTATATTRQKHWTYRVQLLVDESAFLPENERTRARDCIIGPILHSYLLWNGVLVWAGSDSNVAARCGSYAALYVLKKNEENEQHTILVANIWTKERTKKQCVLHK